MWIEYIKVLLFMPIVRITQEHKVITVYILGPPYGFVNKSTNIRLCTSLVFALSFGIPSLPHCVLEPGVRE